MVDFSYKSQKKDQEHTLIEARQKMAKRVMNLTKVYTSKYISTKSIREVIKSADELADILKIALKEDETIQELGLQVIAISILGITPQPDTRRALEAATREEILKQQDDAIYKRRNFAIEQERVIKENELNTEIKIAEKEKEKHEKKKSEAKAYDSEVLLRTFAGIDTEIIKALAVSGMDSKALIAKAFAEIGDKADKIGVLNVSLDLLEALAKN